MPIDTSWLRSKVRGTGRQDVISDDRPCRRCKYNLRGLKDSGVCPECGTVISEDATGEPGSTPEGRRRPGLRSLSHLPLTELRLFGITATCLSHGMLLMLAGWVSAWAIVFLNEQGWAAIPSLNRGVLLAVAAVPGAIIWSAGVFLLTARGSGSASGAVAPKRVSDELMAERSPTFITIVRATQAVWVAVAAAATLGALLKGHASNVGNVMLAVAMLGTVVGSLGLVPTCVVLRDAAHVCHDDRARDRFMRSAVTMALVGLLASISPSLTPFLGLSLGFSGIVFLAGFLIVGVMVCVFMSGLLSLSSSARWAQRNALSAIDRDERFRAKSEEEGRRERERTAGQG